MAESIKIDINVADNGTTDKANKNAEQLRATLKSAAAAAESIRIPVATAAAREGVARSQASSQPKSAAYKAATGPSGRASDTNLSRGLAGQTGASGRDFAAQAQGLGGLVHVYATFAANLFAVSAAFNALSKAADISNIVKGLDQLGAVSGRSLGGLAKQMVLVTGGAISMQQAMTSTALATAGGLSSANILRMTEVAKKASLALGRDMPDSMDRLTKGIVKVQPELLDELGIMARVIPAHQAYAKALGKSTTELTDFEKRQAFANAVLDEGERKFGQIKLDSNPYSKLSASVQNIVQSFLELINTPVGAFISVLADNSALLALALAAVGKTLLNMAIPGLTAYKISMVDLAKKSKDYATTTRAASNQEVSDLEAMLGEKDSAASAAAEKAYQTAYNSKRKIRQLDEGVVGKEVAAIAKKSPFDLTPGEIATIKSKQKELASSSLDIEQQHSKELGNLYNSIEKAKVKSGKIGQAASDDSAAKDVENTKQLAALKDRTNSINQRYHLDNIKAITAETQATKGMIAALTSMNAQLAAAQGGILGRGKLTIGTGTYDKQGKEVTEQISKLNALQRVNETVAGSYGIIKTQASSALSKISTFIGKYGEIGAIIAFVVASVDLLVDTLSSNGKEAKVTRSSFENLTAASEMLNNVMKDLEDRDPLYKISTAAMSAKANAILEVSDASAKAVKALIAENAAASDLDKFFDTTAVAVGFGLLRSSSKALSISVSEAFKLATPGEETTKALREIKELTGVDPTDQKAFREYLNDTPEKFLEIAPKVTTIMQQLGVDLSNTASKGKELDDSFKIAGDTFTAILTSMQPSDDLAKLGFQSIDVSQKMAKAFKDPTTALSKLVEISGDTAKLRFFDPEAASELYKASPKIKEMAADISTYTSALDRLKNEEEALKAKRADTKFGVYQIQFDKEIGDNQKQQKDLINLIDPLKIKIQPYIDKINKEQEAVFARGSQKVADSIGIAFEKAKITEAKAKAAGLGDTAEGIKTRAALEIQSIGLQIRELDAKASLSKVMDNLRIAEEENTLVNQQILLETIQERNRKGGRTPTEANIKQEQKMDSDITNRRVGIEMSKEMGDYTFDQLNQIIQKFGVGDRSVGQARFEAAKILQPGAAITAGAAASKAELMSQQKSISTGAQFSLMDDALKVEKDLAATQLERLLTQQQSLDITIKNSLFLSKSAMKEKERIAEAIALNKEASEYLDIQQEIKKAILGGSDIRDPKSAASELTTKLNNKAERDAQALAKRKAGYAEESLAGKKAEADFDQKIIDIRTSRLSILASGELTVLENRLNLSKELGLLTEEEIAKQTSSLLVSREKERSIDAINALESAKQLEINDYEKRSKDLANASREDKKALNDLHNETILKLDASLKVEKQITSSKLYDLGVQKNINTLNGKLADKIKIQEHERALSQDIFDISTTRLDLEQQLLQNQKELNTVSQEFYINRKADIDLSKLQLSSNLALLDSTLAIENAQEKARIANFAASLMTPNFKGPEGAGAQEMPLTEEQKATQRVLELLNSKRSVLLEQAAISEKLIESSRAQGLELERQNKLLKDQESLASNLTAIFGDMGTALGEVVKGMYASVKAQEDLVKQKQAEIDAAMSVGPMDPKQKYAIDAKYRDLSTKEELSSISTISANSKKLVDQKSVAYRLLDNLEKTSNAIKLGLQLKTMAAEAFNLGKSFLLHTRILQAEVAATGAAQTAIVAENTVGAAGTTVANTPAILSSFATMGPVGYAIGAALVASLLAMVGGGGSAPPSVDMTGKTSAEKQASAGTGGVFGDDSAKSESIAKSMEILASNSIEGLDYDDKLLKAFSKLADSLSVTSQAIYNIPGLRKGGTTFGTQPGTETTSKGGLFGSGFLNSVFGGATTANTSIAGAGINVNGSLQNLIDETEGSITAYKDVLTQFHRDGGWFGSDQDWTTLSRQAVAVGAEVRKGLSDVFKNAKEVFTEVGATAGVGTDAINQAFKSINFSGIQGDIDTMGLTGQAALDQLNAVVGAKLDETAHLLFGGFDKFKKFGEGYLETVVRVTDGNKKVDQALRSVGNSFNIIGKFDISEAMIKAAGGLEKFMEQSSFFKDAFLTDAQRLAPVQESVSKQLTKLSINTNISREEFAKLVNAQDLSTDAGQKMYQSLMDLAPGLDTVLKASEAAKALADSALDLEIKIYQLKGSNEALNLTRQKELDAMDAALRPRQRYLNALTDEIALRDKLKSAYDTTNNSLTSSIKSLQDYKTALLGGSSSTMSPAEKYAQSKAIFEQTSAAAKATITTSSSTAEIKTRDDAVANLSKASDSFLANSKVMNASGTQYAADFAAVGTAIDATSSILTTQQTEVQEQLGFLDKIAAATDTTAQLLEKYLTAVGVTTIAQASATASGSTAAGVPYAKYAAGGLASGMSLVGEQGPELVDFVNPGRVYSNADSKNLFNNDALIAEVKALREEVTKLREDQKEQTGHLIATTFTANARNAEAINNGNVQALNQQNWKARSGVTVV